MGKAPEKTDCGLNMLDQNLYNLNNIPDPVSSILKEALKITRDGHPGYAVNVDKGGVNLWITRKNDRGVEMLLIDQVFEDRDIVLAFIRATDV